MFQHCANTRHPETSVSSLWKQMPLFFQFLCLLKSVFLCKKKRLVLATKRYLWWLTRIHLIDVKSWVSSYNKNQDTKFHPNKCCLDSKWANRTLILLFVHSWVQWKPIKLKIILTDLTQRFYKIICATLKMFWKQLWCNNCGTSWFNCFGYQVI